MALQRRRWYKNLRQIIDEQPDAFDVLNEYEEFNLDNPQGVFYKFCLFFFCLLFQRHFVELKYRERALRYMTDYAEDLEIRLAHSQSHVKSLLDNQAELRVAREKYAVLRRERRDMKSLAVQVRE